MVVFLSIIQRSCNWFVKRQNGDTVFIEDLFHLPVENATESIEAIERGKKSNDLEKYNKELNEKIEQNNKLIAESNKFSEDLDKEKQEIQELIKNNHNLH